MDCPETKKSLSDFLDDRLSPEAAEEVSAHVAGCTACRAELADLRRIDALLGGFADPPVDDEKLATMWSRVEAQLDIPEAADVSITAALGPQPILMAPQPASQPRWLVPTLVAVGVATVAVTVFAVALLLQSPARKSAPSELASSSGDSMGATMGHAMDTMTSMASGNAMRNVTDGMDAAMTTGMDAMGAMDAMDSMSAMAGMNNGSDAMGSEAMSTTGRRRRRRRGGTSSGRVMSSGRTRTMSAGRTMSAARAMSSGASTMSGSNSLQDLLRRAGGSMSMSGGSSAGASNLPSRLSPSKIRKGVYRVMGSARACFNRYRVPGKCRVRVVIRGSSGRVSSASVLGSFKGTPTGRCVARAFRRAKFAKFSSSTQSFVFPLIFR